MNSHNVRGIKLCSNNSMLTTTIVRKHPEILIHDFVDGYKYSANENATGNTKRDCLWRENSENIWLRTRYNNGGCLYRFHLNMRLVDAGLKQDTTQNLVERKRKGACKTLFSECL